MDTINSFLVFSVFSLRYLLFAGGAYLLFYIIKREPWKGKKILRSFPANEQIRRELFFSFISILIFILSFMFIALMYKNGYTLMYSDISSHGLLYFLLSIPLLFLFHDTYFYWTHRLLHLKPFDRFHRIHHRSVNTSPFTAFSFHPVEAVIQSGLAVVVFIIPVHPAAFSILMFGQMAFNVIGHLGYELVPLRFHDSWLGSWFNTTTHHHQHHRQGNANFGLYFNFWDKILHTNHANYEKKYRESARKMFNPQHKSS